MKAALIRTLLMLLGAAVSVSGQATTDWKNGIVKIETNAGAPGAGFMVAVGADHVFIVTAAHVVAGDSNPSIFFLIDEYNPFPGNVIGSEGADERGLALIRVGGNLPKKLIALAPAESPLQELDQVIVAGFPRSLGSVYAAIGRGVASVRGRDVALDRRVEDGYSGGPVLRDGNVGALLYGERGDYGLAIPAESVKLYLRGHGIPWAARATSVRGAPAKVSGGNVGIPPTPVGEGAGNPAAKVERPQEPAPGTVRKNPDDGLDYVWIPPGEFPMGCSPGDSDCGDDEGEKPHTVKITKGFWVGQTEVTVGAYRRFADNTPGIEMPSAPDFNSDWDDLEQPIVSVTWEEAKIFYCEEWAKGRLPTEADWEYAARGRRTTARYGELAAIAWYTSNHSCPN